MICFFDLWIFLNIKIPLLKQAPSMLWVLVLTMFLASPLCLHMLSLPSCSGQPAHVSEYPLSPLGDLFFKSKPNHPESILQPPPISEVHTLITVIFVSLLTTIGSPAHWNYSNYPILNQFILPCPIIPLETTLCSNQIRCSSVHSLMVGVSSPPICCEYQTISSEKIISWSVVLNSSQIF